MMSHRIFGRMEVCDAVALVYQGNGVFLFSEALCCITKIPLYKGGGIGDYGDCLDKKKMRVSRRKP